MNYFGNVEGDQFPLLVKIIDAKQDLSVQVHPDNEYAKIHENSLGKTESWYVLQADDGTDMVMGHYAKLKKNSLRILKKISMMNYSIVLKSIRVISSISQQVHYMQSVGVH